MGPGRYSTITGAQREELWRRYKAGEAVLGIGRALGQRTSNLYRVLQAAGGIAAGATFRGIARSLHRAVSTVNNAGECSSGRSGLGKSKTNQSGARRPENIKPIVGEAVGGP